VGENESWGWVKLLGVDWDVCWLDTWAKFMRCDHVMLKNRRMWLRVHMSSGTQSWMGM
jgi:hypothetical protein